MKILLLVALVTMTLICEFQKLGLLVQTYLHVLDRVNSAIHILEIGGVCCFGLHRGLAYFGFLYFFLPVA